MRLNFAVPFPVCLSRARLALALLFVTLLAIAPSARAQFSAPPTTQVHDASPLKPPAGAHVAMIEFYDLECPQCALTNPTLIAAANQYKIPWIRYDFLIPNHIWSRQAAITARFFDTKSVKLGNDYRDYIFANQISIETLPALNTWTQKFAQAHGVTLPTAVDPMGVFAAKIQADVDLGRRIGIEHTPTIFIVASGGRAPAYTEVVDRNRLFQTIDEVLAEAKR
ncbi:MAG: thioredoxin domain-containing protein [Terracidiphilus sp.]|jgi:protein-disulfide isomerase